MAKQQNKKKGGRKPLWEVLNMESKLDSVKGWAMHGSTDIEMAQMIGISERVFYEWKKKYPQFAQSIKKGKYDSNGELLNSAFTQSTGFMYIENVPVKVKDYRYVIHPETGESELKQVERVEVVPVERYAPPNPTMNIFMLKNRMSEHYRDKPDAEEKLKKLIALLAKLNLTEEEVTELVNQI